MCRHLENFSSRNYLYASFYKSTISLPCLIQDVFHYSINRYAFFNPLSPRRCGNRVLPLARDCHNSGKSASEMRPPLETRPWGAVEQPVSADKMVAEVAGVAAIVVKLAGYSSWWVPARTARSDRLPS